MNDKTENLVSPDRRHGRRLKIIGTAILLFGIAGAGIVYWTGMRDADVSGELSMAGFNKSEERQMAILYGKSGELIEDWSNDLKQPGTQAFIIAAVSIVIASGCFYFARLSEEEDATR